MRILNLPDGYNGAIKPFYAEPIERDGSGSLKLRCAAPGMEGCIRWVSESEYALALLRERVERADKIILLLTADHNTGANYVKGFEEAQEYFQDYPQLTDWR
jgi:hypothetical protein